MTAPPAAAGPASGRAGPAHLPVPLRLVLEDGQVVAEPGRGQWMRRNPIAEP
ncbi:MAG TPA: hypothetical protein VK162_10640 [Streptosporangiaceae bacterium]|nr:hypothetical protein [Streptosporangiaceae bacterium]